MSRQPVDRHQHRRCWGAEVAIERASITFSHDRLTEGRLLMLTKLFIIVSLTSPRMTVPWISMSRTPARLALDDRQSWTRRQALKMWDSLQMRFMLVVYLWLIHTPFYQIAYVMATCGGAWFRGKGTTICYLMIWKVLGKRKCGCDKIGPRR